MGLVALYQTVVRKGTGHIPRLPWIPFSARRVLESLIQPSWRVWEIGAGYSTLWMADRVGHLTSIEANREWFDRLTGIIRQEGVSNVDLRYEWVAGRMADFSEILDGSLDLLFVDAGDRALCLRQGFAKVRAGGYIYLDNWDSREFWTNSKEFLAQNSDQIESSRSFIDYVPAQFGVYEGLLIRKKEGKRSAGS